jgi:hypothetical protein
MYCCWTPFFIRLVFTVFLCTSIVSAAPIPVRRQDAPPTPPSANTISRSGENIPREGSSIVDHKAIAGVTVRRANNDTLSQLFPVQGSGPKWTTLDGANGALPLNDGTLRPHNVAQSDTRTYVKYNGISSLKAHYPAGSWNPQGNPKGGLSFYAPGPADVNLETAQEVIFSYSVLFPEGFDFVKGGKLPGLC